MNHEQVAVADHRGGNTLYTHRIDSSLVIRETLSVARVFHFNDQDDLFFASDIHDGRRYRINANDIRWGIFSNWTSDVVVNPQKRVRYSEARIHGDLIAGRMVFSKESQESQDVLCVRDIKTAEVVRFWDMSRLCLRPCEWSFNSQMVVIVKNSRMNQATLSVTRFRDKSTFQQQLPYFVLSVDINSRNELCILSQKHGLYLQVFDVL
jgi:hypothetical protein